MSGYILSLLGVVLLGVLVDIILPAGSTSKYISGMFAIFVLFVIISPVLNFVRSDYKLSNYFTSTDIELDEKLLNNIYTSRVNAMEDDIELDLNDKGYQGVELEIKFDMVADNVKIQQVLVNLNNLVINAPEQNINKYVYIRQVVMEHLLVEEEVIVFCE